jgi:anaerobic dimethyl sulfoxide reductase subunit B (iron-sulfur subunit)
MTTVQLGFSFDLSRCSGCMACMVACFDQNDMPGNGSTFRHVSRIETGAYPLVNIRYVSLACMHCGDAPCIAVCPTRALSKRPDGGVVVVSRDLCIGCHACATVCPFGAPQFPEGTLMRKCDFCVARVSSGLEPACVRTCPTRALGFGPIEKLAGEKAKAASARAISSFNPNLVLTLAQAPQK